MGELSKYFGQIGENIAKVFFEKIGWKDLIQNQTLPCIYKIKHELKKGKERNTHGIDNLFSYLSQTESATIQNVYISCKNTSKPYPSNPTLTFKNHMQDLIYGLECFKNSHLKHEITNHFSGFSNQKDSGVLFWISCNEMTYNNVIDKIKSCRIEFDYDFGNIYIIDNEIAMFHIKLVNYIESNFKNYNWSYYLPETGITYSDKSIIRRTKILPVEFINSKFIAFRLDNVNSNDNKPVLLIATKDNFNKINLEMYIHVAREYTSEITNKYYFLFPDFNKIEHEPDVKQVKMSIPEDLKISFEIDSYNYQGIRGLYND